MEPVATHAYPGIEVLPQEYDQFGNSPQYSSLPGSGDKGVHTTNTPTTNDRHPTRILGLTVPVFWALLIIFVLVLAGALGGGIGGGLAAQKHSAGDSGSSAVSPTSTTTLQAGEQPTGTGTVTLATLLPIMQPNVVPNDGGCPGNNATRYVSPVTLRGQTVNQTFERRCDTNYADGVDNRGLRDLLSFFTKTFDECMNMCAQYNMQLQQQQEAASQNVGTGGEGYCNVATIAKLPGGRCYLKSQGDAPLKNTLLPGEEATAAELVEGIGRPTKRHAY